MHRTRTAASAVLLTGIATLATAGIASAQTSHEDQGDDQGRTGLVSGVAEGVGGLIGGGAETVGNLLGSDLAGPLLDGVL